MIRRTAPLFAFSSLLLAACDPSPMRPPCGGDAECDPGQVCVDGRCQARPATDAGEVGEPDGGGPRPDAGPGVTLEEISIEPASADLVSVDGSTPARTFAVVGRYSDGMTRPVPGPTFSIEPRSLGEIDPASGMFVANGIIGGTATVSATAAGPAGELRATATVNVRLERTILVTGAPADAASRFAGPALSGDARRAHTVYPLDGAVMPQNVYPADIQWLIGGAGDLFRVRLEKPHVTVSAYLAHDGTLRNHWLVDEAAWRSLAQTDPDDDAAIVVDRIAAGGTDVFAGTPVRVRFARAALTGSVYYWDIVRGRIVRIDDGTATRVELMPAPPVARDGARCVGCHTVSNSGRYMAGRLGGGENIGAVFDLTTDLTGDPPPTVFPLVTGEPSSIRWWFSTWSPDDRRMIATFDEGSTRRLVLYDPYAGASVPYTGTLPSNVTHPAWAPDGSQIAYVSGINSWGGANTTGNISVLEVTGPDAFGATRDLHLGTTLAGETPGGNADSYPTWSPDSSRIAFAHGTGSRSDTDTPPIHYSALYLMQRDGSGAVRLGRVSAPGVQTEDFQPRFSPFTQGGYFWLSYLSRRDYGNAEVGTRDGQRQQIWVSAIRVGAAPGEDPSSVPYWLPGQNPASRNISAYWAPRPCRPDGESCSVGSECCGGDCRPGPGGALVCSPPPPDRCRMVNETCSTDEDCCDGLSCFANVCVSPPG
ncbi:MAG: PD40 domain-containing protein [Sandaracinaceae bacterium]|nr:PD40 domain-containing protein [Sandaracinaceae bacterium]